MGWQEALLGQERRGRDLGWAQQTPVREFANPAFLTLNLCVVLPLGRGKWDEWLKSTQSGSERGIGLGKARC